MALRLGIITGSGSYSLAGFESVLPRDVRTPFGDAHVNVGNLLVRENNQDDAIPHYAEALRIRPDDPDLQVVVDAPFRQTCKSLKSLI